MESIEATATGTSTATATPIMRIVATTKEK